MSRKTRRKRRRKEEGELVAVDRESTSASKEGGLAA